MAVKKKAARPKPAAKAKAPAKETGCGKHAAAMDEQAMMQQWQAAMTPSVGHARLMSMVGTWRAKTTFTMAPGAPDQVSDGTSVHRLVLGGRFLEQVYKGMNMGMPFEGIGFTGYDNVQKRYVGSWMDTFSTGIMTSVGTGKPDDEKIEFVCEAIEPSGKKRSLRRDRAHEGARSSFLRDVDEGPERKAVPGDARRIRKGVA